MECYAIYHRSSGAGTVTRPAKLGTGEPCMNADTNISPVTLAERGGYFISGERIDTPGGPRIYGQSFVQYEIPAEVRHPYPVVFVHGGGGQGLDFSCTPDGREGWAGDFLRAGYKVFVIDRQGHGRARQNVESPAPAGSMLPLD